MSYAPKGCEPTVITEESILEDKAKKLHKTVKEMTEKEKQDALKDYRLATEGPYDMASE